MRTLAAFAVLMFVTACQTAPPEMTEAEVAQIAEEVAAVGDQWMASLTTLDVESHAAACDPATMHGNDGATYYGTYDEWIAHVEALFGGFVGVEGGWQHTRIDVLSTSAALFAGKNNMIMTRADGRQSRMEGSVSLTVRKIDGLWKIIHQSSVGRWTAVEEG